MAFDKEEYRKLREQGLRGQGYTRKPRDVSRYPHYRKECYQPAEKPLSQYAIRKNTKRARKAAQKELENAAV